MAEKLNEGSYIIYKDRPLLMGEHEICYGDMNEQFYLHLIPATYTEVSGIQVPNLIIVEVKNTKTGETIKQDFKTGLYDALDFGIAWLDRAIREGK